jgi:hypothetical protein
VGLNDALVGKAIRGRRDWVVLATKFAIVRVTSLKAASVILVFAR